MHKLTSIYDTAFGVVNSFHENANTSLKYTKALNYGAFILISSRHVIIRKRELLKRIISAMYVSKFQASQKLG
jgi:hypothetical protein